MKTNSTPPALGIWMDHSSANFIEFTVAPMLTKTIVSKFTHEVKIGSMNKGENLMHNKEQALQSEFYKSIAKVILGYNNVILFGPTDAKVELFNILEGDNRFDKIRIELKQTDKMTENQQNSFVKDHFSKHVVV